MTAPKGPSEPPPEPRPRRPCGLCSGSGVLCSKDNEWEPCYRCGGTGEEAT